MSTDQDKLNSVLGSERPVPGRATAGLKKLAIFVTLLTTCIGCSPAPPPPRDPPKPVKPERRDSTNPNPNVPSTSPHNPADRIDLGPAVQETREIFRKRGLPEDWYQSLTANANESNNHSVLVCAIWAMVGPEVAAQFQQRYRMAGKPLGRVSAEELWGDNRVFDELLHRAFRGEQHGDHPGEMMTSAVTQGVKLPNVNPEFLGRDGAVAFAKVRAAIAAECQVGTKLSSVNEDESATDEDGEWCRVVGEWQSPPHNLPAWAVTQLFWRPCVIVEYVEGNRTVRDVINSGDRRLALSSYADVGYRKTENARILMIHRAGPYTEMHLQPVGTAYGGVTPTRRHRSPPRPCPHDSLFSSDLESSVPLDAAERENWWKELSFSNDQILNGSGFEEPLYEIHAKLSSLIQKR